MASAKPVDIYIRVSRVGGREHLISPAEQERRARTLAHERGLTVGRVLPPDLDESGGKLERPGLQEALRRVESGESGGIIVAWLDRLSRDSEHAHGLLRRIDTAGGRVYAPDAPEDMTTPEGELMTGILFGFAQYVRKRARAGLERAKENAVANGIPVVTRPAVGYRQREDRRLEPDPATAAAVGEVFERRAAGAGPSELGDLLQAHGVRTSQGSETWSRQAVYGLLANRVYLGELRYGSDDRYANTASHEPLVDLATWTAAQHPHGRAPLAATSERSAWLLTGVLRCHACRYCMQGTTTGRGKRIYRCTRRHAAGTCPAPARIDAGLVEDAAVGAFWALTADLEAKAAPMTASDDLAGLQEALQRAERRLGQVESEDMQDALGERWASVARERRAARDAAAANLGHGRAAASEREAPVAIVTLRATWEDMSTRERRDLLGARFDALALRRDPRELVAFPAGTAPDGMPRRGYRRRPELRPFPEREPAHKGTIALWAGSTQPRPAEGREQAPGGAR